MGDYVNCYVVVLLLSFLSSHIGACDVAGIIRVILTDDSVNILVVLVLKLPNEQLCCHLPQLSTKYNELE